MLILEHLAVNSEEKELAEYRAAEGKGMMLWGNLRTMRTRRMLWDMPKILISVGFITRRGDWTTPHVVGYMESHDEERLMYKNLQFGNSASGYNVKTADHGTQKNRSSRNNFLYHPRS